jgi:anti-anti-sigma factor
MRFTREIQDKFVIERVNLSRATLKEAESFKQVIEQDLSEGWTIIIIDLSECEFIDSTFLGALVVSLKKVKSIGGVFKLVGFQPAVESMFELTRMYRVFEAYKTREEAIEALEK